MSGCTYQRLIRARAFLEIILFAVKPAGRFDEAAASHLRAILEQGALGAGAFDTDNCQATYAELSAKGGRVSLAAAGAAVWDRGDLPR